MQCLLCLRRCPIMGEAARGRKLRGSLMRLFCFGFGYSAESLARRLSGRTMALAGTRTSVAGDRTAPLGARLAEFKGDAGSAEVRSLLADATHILVSIPPDLEGDVVLR